MLGKLVRKSLLTDIKLSAWMLVSLATCALLVTLFAVTALGAGRQMRSTLRRLGANAVLAPVVENDGNTGGDMDWKRLSDAVRGEGATLVRLEMRVGLVSQRPVAIVAADADKLAALTPFWDVKGRRPTAPDECLLGSRLANVLDTGDSIVVDLPRSGRQVRFKIVGTATTGDEDDNRIYVTGFKSDPPPVTPQDPPAKIDVLGSPQRASAADETAQPATTESDPARINIALISVPGGLSGIERLISLLQGQGFAVTIEPLRQIIRGEESVLTRIALLTGISLAAVLTLTVLGISAAMLARMIERRKEYALMQALGAKRRQVTYFILAEATVLGVVASLIGYGAGAITAQWIFYQIFHVHITPQAVPLVGALVLTTGVALLAGALGARRALKLNPAVVLRGE
ncbi:ABC transporter permease [bacterium]|nr:ABC transporter permease [bacterium]